MEAILSRPRCVKAAMVQNYLFLIMLYSSRLVTWWCQKTVKTMDNNAGRPFYSFDGNPMFENKTVFILNAPGPG